ncbi:venom carboxylesterase-6-like [Thrips palmi]|uniref:Venom carboxylesterase-6-like n=1 Tax=Thrips palmi TaxID=161013 RepID=A0A6P9A3Q4_THRPL|nr:venom carboxylesterase-6-like [Thrips palmi]
MPSTSACSGRPTPATSPLTNPRVAEADATPPRWPRRFAAVLKTLVLAACLLGLRPALGEAAVLLEVPGVGVLRGTTQRSADNAPFAAFEGVPYAKPPVGALRFQPAKPSASSPFMVLNATSQTMPCPYLSDKGVLVGVEDCLYLSVYTPQVNAAQGLPVLVVLPGDDWTRGYAGRWKPHRLVDRGVVVVTVQSRLGALGFLTTGDADAPGNLGLKDERLALSWVQQNVRAFGGDPGNVTVAGVGAGAAAAMLHAVTSKGLLQRVIAVSGSALSPWSLTENTQAAVDVPARRLAEAMRCDCPIPVPAAANATANASVNAAALNSTRPANLTDMVECLRSRSVAEVLYASARLQGWAGLPPAPFGPVVELHGVQPFLADAPLRLWRHAGVPLLLGLSGSEGLQTLAGWEKKGLLHNSSLLNQLDADWARLAPVLLAFNSTPELDKSAASEDLRRRYLGNGTAAEDAEGVLRLFADRHVVVPALRAAIAHAQQAEQAVYLYRFGWSATQEVSALAGPAGGSDANLLLMQPSATEAQRLPAQKAMVGDILDVWASFIQDGVPSLGNTTLQSVAVKDAKDVPEDLPVLELQRPGVHRQGNWSVHELLAFWDGLPLLENKKPPSETTTVAAKTDSQRNEMSSSSNKWEHFRLLLLAALPLLCLNWI